MTKITSSTGETSSELCRRLVSSINLSKQTFKSFPKHVRESTDAVVWEADSADSLKDAKLFLSSLPNIRLHDPIFLNPTITVLGLPTWVSDKELETSLNLLFPSAHLGIQGKRSVWSHEGSEDEKILITKIQRSKRESAKISRLKCFYVNARSVVNKDKRTELELYVDKENPDVIGITESWAKKAIEDSELELDGYIMLRKDREIHGGRGHGGGVLLYIKDNLMAFERTDLKDDRFKKSVWCEIKKKNEKIVIGLCHRPPDSEVKKTILDFMN